MLENFSPFAIQQEANTLGKPTVTLGFPYLSTTLSATYSPQSDKYLVPRVLERMAHGLRLDNCLQGVRGTIMKATTLRFALLMVTALVGPSIASARGLEQQTLEAWNDYIQAVN